MKRNIKAYAKQGARRVDKRHDIMLTELRDLVEMASKDRDGLYNSITTAYYMGIEAGARLAMKER